MYFKDSYGFIHDDVEDRQLFVHATNIVNARRLVSGDRVSFRIGRANGGREQAIECYYSTHILKPLFSVTKPSSIVSGIEIAPYLARFGCYFNVSAYGDDLTSIRPQEDYIIAELPETQETAAIHKTDDVHASCESNGASDKTLRTPAPSADTEDAAGDVQEDSDWKRKRSR